MPFHDQPVSLPSSGSTSTSRRVALVIGNGAYPAAPLRNPPNDARAFADKLAAITPTFDVTVAIDVGRDAMEDALEAFELKLGDCDTALLFFAGHGLQVKGLNYLMPVDADIRQEIHLRRRAFQLNEVLDIMSRRVRTSSLVILDACRNNPFARSLAAGLPDEERGWFVVRSGLAEVRAASGSFIAFATAPDNVALDGSGDNSPFTSALLSHMTNPDQSISDAMIAVRQDVLRLTGGHQEPWDQSSLRQRFCFHTPGQSSGGVGSSTGPSDFEAWRIEWEAHKDGSVIADLRDIAEHGHPYFASKATARLAVMEAELLERHAREAAERDRLRAEQSAAEAQRREAEALATRHEADWQRAAKVGTSASYVSFLSAWSAGPRRAEAQQALARAQSREQEAEDRKAGRISVRVGDGKTEKTIALKFGESTHDIDIGPELVLVPPGKFWQGSKDGEGKFNEHPRYEGIIYAPLLVGKYPITVAEWDAAVAARGVGYRGWGNKRRPVTGVSWHDAVAYATWLSKATGKNYRLLTETEWEYCCRAGTATAYSFGDTITKAQAQFSEGEWGNAEKTVEVGSFPANAFGLHDMHGNVWEWCQDEYFGRYGGISGGRTRVLRGGSWKNFPEDLRSAVRNWNHPGNSGNYIGFRLARTLDS
jgi:formylglycine-generating enzyme required for sulfatase activity